jgi:hypothetical protein
LSEAGSNFEGDNSMHKLTAAAFAAGAMICIGIPSSSAAPNAPALGKSLSQPSMVETVQVRRSCRFWYRECRARWGWGWRFRRCVVRHGC